MRCTDHDRTYTAHRLQATLTPAQTAILVHLLRTLLSRLDDSLAFTWELLCEAVSNSGLDRCLRHRGVGNLKALKSYVPSYSYMNVKHPPRMADITRENYLLVAVDRATRWVFVAIKNKKNTASTHSFMNPRYKACSINNYQVPDLRRQGIHGKTVCRT